MLCGISQSVVVVLLTSATLVRILSTVSGHCVALGHGKSCCKSMVHFIAVVHSSMTDGFSPLHIVHVMDSELAFFNWDILLRKSGWHH